MSGLSLGSWVVGRPRARLTERCYSAMLSSGGSGGIGALGLMYRIGTAFELANRWREQRLLLQHLLTCN